MERQIAERKRAFALARSPDLRSPALVVAYAIVVVVFGSVVTISLPLYLPTCPCDHPHFSNVVGLPLVPLAAGVLLAVGLARSGSERRVAAGLGVILGVASAMYAGLLGSVAFALREQYLTAPYRAYGLGYLALVSATAFTASGLVLRRREGLRRGLGIAFLASAVLAIVAAALRGEFLIAAPAAMGAALGWVFAVDAVRSFPWRRIPIALVVALLVAISFAVRAGFGLQTLARLGPGMPFAITSDDGDAYYQGALAILTKPDGLQLALSHPWFPPGYTVFLAGVLGRGENFAAVVLAQAALGAVATLLLYLVAREVLRPALALLAALLFAVDVDLVHASSTLTAEALLLPLLGLGLYGAVRYERTGRLRWLLVSAASLGLAFITRNLAIVLVVSILLWLGVRRWRTPLALTRDVGIVLGAVVLFTLPTAVATSAGPEVRLTNQSSLVAFDHPVNGVTIDNQELVRRGIHFTKDPVPSVVRLIADPVFAVSFYARAIPNRVSTMLFAPSPGVFDPVALINPAIYPSAFGQLLELIRALALPLTAFLFFRRRTYRHDPVTALFAGFAVLYLALFTVVFLPSHPFRYRLPLEPMLFLAQAAALGYVVRQVAAWWTAGEEPAAGNGSGVSLVGRA